MLVKRLLGNPQNAAGLLPVGKKLVAQLLASNIPYLRKAFSTGVVEVRQAGSLVILTISGYGCELPFVVGMAISNGSLVYFGLYRRGESYKIRKFEIEGADTILSDRFSVAFAPFRGYALGEAGVDDFHAMFSKTTCALVRGRPTFYGDKSYIAGEYVFYPDCTLMFMHFQGVDTGAYWVPAQNALYYTQTTAYGKTLDLSAVTVTYATRYHAGYLLRTPYSFMFGAVNIPAPSDVTVPVDPENPTSEEEKFLTARENAFTIHMPEALHGAYGDGWLPREYTLPKWYYFSPYCFYLLTITRTPAYYLKRAYLHDTYIIDDNIHQDFRGKYPYGHCYISVMLYDALGGFEFIRLRTLEPIGSYSEYCLKARTIGHVTFMEDVSNRYCGILVVVADSAAPMPRWLSDIPDVLDEQKPVVLVNIIEPGVHTTNVVYEFSISAETAPWFGVGCFLPDTYTPRQRWALQPTYVPAVDRIAFYNASGLFSCRLDGSDQRQDFVPDEGFFLGHKMTIEGPWLFGHVRTPDFENTRFFVYDFISMETTWLDSSIFEGVTGVAETSVCTAVSQASYTGAA